MKTEIFLKAHEKIIQKRDTLKFQQPVGFLVLLVFFFLVRVESELGHSVFHDFFSSHALPHTAITTLDLDHSHRRFSNFIF